MTDRPHRGKREFPRTDLQAAQWQRNEFGVDVLMLSKDESSGALTMALRTPAGLQYPEREHFYDCDQDLFQFEGEFHHDEERPFHAGDYVYRPPGTVYGRTQGSLGGIIIASLNNQPRRYHFDDHPEWEGEYLIDRAWQKRKSQPLLVHSGEVEWTSTPFGKEISIRKLRGEPGKRTPEYGFQAHSPWGADAVAVVRIAAGYVGPMPEWSGTILETLVVRGSASIDGQPWYRGCYGFDVMRGTCEINEDFEFYTRFFLPPRPA